MKEKNKTTIIFICIVAITLVSAYFLYQKSIKNNLYRDYASQLKKFKKAMNVPKDFNFEIPIEKDMESFKHESYEQQLQAFNEAKGDIVIPVINVSEIPSEENSNNEKTYEQLLEEFNKAKNVSE